MNEVETKMSDTVCVCIYLRFMSLFFYCRGISPKILYNCIAFTLISACDSISVGEMGTDMSETVCVYLFTFYEFILFYFLLPRNLPPKSCITVSFLFRFKRVTALV